MRNKKIRWSYFDMHTGAYDEYNPRYVYQEKQVPEISYLIASKPPFSLSKDDIMERLQIDSDVCNRALDVMCKINAIIFQMGKYKINYPVILEQDLVLLGGCCQDMGRVIGEKIFSLQDKIDAKLAELSYYNRHKIERFRYHVIGCEVLDGQALECFAKNKLLTTSKIQPGGRDYLIIGREESVNLVSYIDQLFCSCNTFDSDNICFTSFGDSNGFRKDMMRFFNRLQVSIAKATEHNGLNLFYSKLIDDYNQLIAKKSASLLAKILEEDISIKNLNKKEQTLIGFLQELGYINYVDENSPIFCRVPVFVKKDRRIIDQIGQLILQNIFSTVKCSLEILEKNLSELTAVKHGVDFQDIANELWHLIFGQTNEYLVESGFFPTPEYKKGEGRYLQCLYIWK